jgi:putative SOS response-associated peptidase YedK
MQRAANAKAETVASLPMFREGYARRRCILPVDGFFEWKAIKGTTAKQRFAIAMHDGSPFGIAGIWENWKDSAWHLRIRLHVRCHPCCDGLEAFGPIVSRRTDGFCAMLIL